jgi:flavin-dependent dehydrogenase
MTGYDAIIVGGRCAGASTAMLLARAGLRVLLVDRATFPSDVPRGHFIHRDGPRRLAKWGLLDRVLGSGCPSVTTITQDLGDFPLTGRDVEVGGIPFGVGPRRIVLDQILIEAAAAAGADVRDGFAVLEYATERDRITGIRGRDSRSGRVVEERASIVVGADGRNSGLARTVQAPLTVSAPTVACWYFTYLSGVALAGLEMHVRDRRALFAFPTNDELVGVFVGWPIAELRTVKRDIDRAVADVLAAVPEVGERIRAGHREERWMGAAQLPNLMRRPHGAGWALVGDAGCHKDPMMALGICDALRDAESLADAIAEGLGGRRPLAAALLDYERRRDQATLSDFHVNLAAARLGPASPDVYALRAAVRGDEEATRAYFLARAWRQHLPLGGSEQCFAA